MFRVYFILIFLCYYAIGILDAQNKEELEKRRIEAQKIIENTSRLLEETGRSRRSSIERLNIVNRRLQERENIIKTIEAEIMYLDNAVIKGENRINELKVELKEAQKSYARLINIAYKHRFTHQALMFIFSSENFNQAYRRFRYLQQYGQSRKKQILRIQSLTDQIVIELEDLESKKNEKVALLTEKKNETNLLSTEKSQQRVVLQDLQKQEAKLKDEIQKQKKVALSLERAIEALLKEETDMRTEKEIYELTPEERIISEDFNENKGGLPWPIDRGIVTGFFGEHNHPVLKGIKLQNNGIDISTNDNAEVRSLFRGVVRSVLTVPGANNVVIIRHGNYFSVYANLSHVYVRIGDVVNTLQLIGRVFTDNEEDNNSILHLEIWEENIKLDPVLWLSSQ